MAAPVWHWRDTEPRPDQTCVYCPTLPSLASPGATTIKILGTKQPCPCYSTNNYLIAASYFVIYISLPYAVFVSIPVLGSSAVYYKWKLWWLNSIPQPNKWHFISVIIKFSVAEVCSVGGHQTHAVVVAGYGHVTHCSPLVLFRVVDNHVSKVVTIIITATCSA